MKIAVIKFCGHQEGFGSVPGFNLYNVLSCTPQNADIAENSSQTVRQLTKRGWIIFSADLETHNKVEEDIKHEG
jgi:hypothetical protein